MENEQKNLNIQSEQNMIQTEDDTTFNKLKDLQKLLKKESAVKELFIKMKNETKSSQKTKSSKTKSSKTKTTKKTKPYPLPNLVILSITIFAETTLLYFSSKNSFNFSSVTLLSKSPTYMLNSFPIFYIIYYNIIYILGKLPILATLPAE